MKSSDSSQQSLSSPTTSPISLRRPFLKSLSSTSTSRKGHSRCSNRGVLKMFGLAVVLTVILTCSSLMHESQRIISDTSIQTRFSYSYTNGDTDKFFIFQLPPSTENNKNNNNKSTGPSSSKVVSSSLSFRNMSSFSLEDFSSLPSKLFLSLEAQSHLRKMNIVNQQRELDPRPFVAIVMCIRSKPNWTHINETTLYTLLIPSIEKTVTKDEWDTFRIELFLGFDVGDAFWEDELHRNLLQSTTTKTSPQLSINFMALTTQRPDQIPFNFACRAAFELGSDYIVRINDDTEFLTSRWITQGVQRLSHFHPSKLGVVGPRCDQGNTNILTHDMVHRLHLDIFGMEYYPDEFDNWWIDDWISRVYGKNNTQRIEEWKVHHHIHKHGTRYNVDEQLKRHLETTIQRGRLTIRNYIQMHANMDSLSLPKRSIKFLVLGSNRIPAAWGPSMDPFYNE
jgi:hypothetical protein